MPVIEQLELAELVRQTWQRFELSQVKFAKKLGVCLQSVNRWKNGRIKPLPVALKQGDRGKMILAKYFSARGQRIYDF